MRKSIITAIILLTSAICCNAQTITEVRNELRKKGIPCADIVLAQARLETGNFTSARCKRDRNIFGIKHGGKYAKYRRWQDSVTDYKRRISARYKGGSYYHFLTRIGDKYTVGYKNEIQQVEYCEEELSEALVLMMLYLLKHDFTKVQILW